VRKNLPTLLFLAGWALLGILPAEAQLSTGSLIGTVRDESGSVLPGVTVTLTSPAMPGGPATAVTNTQGEYRFTRLEPGVYALSLALSGFGTYRESDLRVAVGGTTERVVTLKVAELAVMGSKSNETTLLTDGVSFNNVRSGGSWLTADFDSAAEISFTTLGPSAEYQAAAGGVLNLVGKSGTNRFSGNVGAFYSPDWLTSKPIKLPCAACEGGESGFTWYNYYDTTGHIGGPIKRDRLWFFGGLIYRGRYGTPPGQAPPPQDERFLDWIGDSNNKITWKIHDRVQFQQTDYFEFWGTVNPNIVSATRPIATLQHSEASLTQDHNPGSQLTWTLGAATVLTARYNVTMGASHRIGFFRDLTTPNRSDSASGVQSGNTNAHRFWPRRDEVSGKVNTYLSGTRVTHNIGYGAQISRNRDVFVQIEPGGVLYSDVNGAPDQATFVGPDGRGAISKAQGFWAEDEITFGGRVTVKPGLRFDRMEGISHDIPQFDLQFNEVGTLKGLGHMITWNTVSPRVGGNIRLTGDGKTVLRAVAGRYYLPLFLGEFEDLHPGRAVRTLTRWNPATSSYSNIVSVTDPRAQVQFDPNTKPPYTDQYSIGVDREIARNMGIGVNVVYKRAGNQLGWKDIGGIYGTSTVVINNNPITVFPLLNSPQSRMYLRTNGPGFYTEYKALMLTATRRLANRWQFTTGYTRQSAVGLESDGRDPNDFINAEGGLGSRDRPHMLSLMGSVEIPKIDVQVSGNLQAVAGTAISSTAQVNLPQGRRTINLEAPGSVYRVGPQNFMHLRFTKSLFRTGPRRLEVTGEVKNALNEMRTTSIRSTIYNNANFLLTNTYPEPRQLRMFLRWFF
jgi:hypothetical protein